MELKKLAAIAEANYIPFAPHNPSGPIANAATMQIAACCPNFCILEIMYSDVDYRCEITNESLIYDQGKLKITDRPGLGIELNEEACLKHPYVEHNLRHYSDALTDIRPAKLHSTSKWGNLYEENCTYHRRLREHRRCDCRKICY